MKKIKENVVRMCGAEVIVYLLVGALFLGGVSEIMAQMRAADPPDVRKYTMTHVFSADFCKPCHDLQKRLKADGYRLTRREITEQPVGITAFPTVVYEDRKGYAHFDDGTLFYNWQTERPDPNKPVQIILWRTK